MNPNDIQLVITLGPGGIAATIFCTAFICSTMIWSVWNITRHI